MGAAAHGMEPAAGDGGGVDRGLALVGAPRVPLTGGAGGSLRLQATIGGVETTFLVDTGAAMMSISATLQRQLRAAGAAQLSRQVEVMVFPDGGRNLLGLNALSRFAPFTVHLQPPALELSGCAPTGAVAAADT